MKVYHTLVGIVNIISFSLPNTVAKSYMANTSPVSGKIIHDLCERKGVTIHEANACSDHIHMLVSIPPKLSVASFMGYLKGKSSLMIFDKHANLKYKYGNRKFWCRGYYVDTVGRNQKGNCRVYSKSITGRQGSRPTHFI